ncbi:MAG: cellulase family glycosylhydrolase, partial [Halanaerobiales bacterium]|jgi:endoglucanase
MIELELDRAVKWAQENKRPLYLGEFGAYERADLESRIRWTNFVAREAEKRNIPWAYWEFNSGFGIYDPVKDQWRDELLQALIPENTD